jgi:cytochrome c553
VQDGGMLVVAPNITSGSNGVTGRYQVADWVRTLRHGVKPDGHPVIVMPSEDYARLSDDDTAALVAYLQQLPPVPGKQAVLQLPLPVQVLFGFGFIKDAAAKIDHTLPPTNARSAGRDAGLRRLRGQQLHRLPPRPARRRPHRGRSAGLAAGRAAGAGQGQRDGALSRCRPLSSPCSRAAAARTAAIRVMPFGSLGKMSDTDMRALYAYLSSLPRGH